MKITLKGNTSKNKTYFAANDEKPAMLYFDVAEKVKKRDGSELTIWHKVKVARAYADVNYRLLHGAEEISRYVQIEGRIVDKPKTRVVNDQVVAYNTIWADEITYLDDKWPKNESGLPAEEDTDEEPADEPASELAPVVVDEKDLPF